MSGPTCNSSSPKQKELTGTLIRLRQQKEELEVKLNGQSCKPDPAEEQLEVSKYMLADATDKVERLKAAKAEMEGRIQCLRGRSAERSGAIETLGQFAEAEKSKLRGEFEEVTKVLQAETEGRINAQSQFESPDDTCPLTYDNDTASPEPPNPFHVDPPAYSYPYDATVERPARYLREHMRNNPVRPIPFPNDAMDEAEAFGGSCSYNPPN